MIIEDGSGKIRLKLWESQVGMVLFGKTYTFSNLSTREFSGELFVTTTRQTSIEQVRSLPGLGAIVPCEVREDPVLSVCGEIIRAEVAVSRTCGNCRCAQTEFDPKKKFHRCLKCNMLQKTGMYQPTAFSNVTVLGDSGEVNVSINNSVLHRYLRNCDLTHLLQDGQDIEEHLLECASLKLHIQNDNVVAVVKVPDETSSTSQECSSESSLSLCAIREARPSTTGDLEMVYAADAVWGTDECA